MSDNGEDVGGSFADDDSPTDDNFLLADARRLGIHIPGSYFFLGKIGEIYTYWDVRNSYITPTILGLR